MTVPHRVQEISASLRVTTAADRPDGIGTTACLNCGKPLDMHQPDPDFPDRMLATCRDCQSWHLIDCDPASDGSLIVLLPRLASLRKALRHQG